MAKTLNTANASTSSPNGTKKQRKKQAKREAKAMLKLEQARKDVQKAEQRLAKAQTQLEADRGHARTLEAQINEMREGQQSHPDQQQEQTPHADAAISTPTNQV